MTAGRCLICTQRWTTQRLVSTLSGAEQGSVTSCEDLSLSKFCIVVTRDLSYMHRALAYAAHVTEPCIPLHGPGPRRNSSFSLRIQPRRWFHRQVLSAWANSCTGIEGRQFEIATESAILCQTVSRSSGLKSRALQGKTPSCPFAASRSYLNLASIAAKSKENANAAWIQAPSRRLKVNVSFRWVQLF
jgi:hypothetical protein